MLKGILLPLSEKEESNTEKDSWNFRMKKEYVLKTKQWNRDVEILMRFPDTLIIDYSVPEPENERGPDLHAETR